MVTHVMLDPVNMIGRANQTEHRLMQQNLHDFVCSIMDIYTKYPSDHADDISAT